MRRARHQKGSLQRVKRKSGESVWIFRWYEVQLDGTKCYRKAVIGSVSDYKTEAEAQKAADALRLEINEQTPRQQLQAISIETLVEHYRLHELPDIVNGTRPLGSQAGEDETRKSFSTQTTYAGYLRKWILPRWRSYRLTDVKAVQVEQWLKSLPVSRGTKAKIRNIMSALYSHAQRWEWTTSNPITHVRQSAKRSRVPTVLNPDELKGFLANLVDPAKTAVLLGALTGLRVGELLGLKWSDIDFEKLEISCHPRRGQAADRAMQDGSLEEGDSHRCGTGRIAMVVAASLRLQPAGRLGVCQPPRQRQAALLAEFALSGVSQAGVRGCRHHGTGGLAHAATQLRNPDEGQRRGHQDDPGTSPPRQLQGDDGCVYASCNGCETHGTQPRGTADHGGKEGGRR